MPWLTRSPAPRPAVVTASVGDATIVIPLTATLAPTPLVAVSPLDAIALNAALSDVGTIGGRAAPGFLVNTSYIALDAAPPDLTCSETYTYPTRMAISAILPATLGNVTAAAAAIRAISVLLLRSA